jgi:hypothetical protein
MEQVQSPESMPPSNVRTALEIRIVRKPQNSPGNDESTMRESCSESESLTESESSTAGNRKTSGQHDTNADAILNRLIWRTTSIPLARGGRSG